MGILKNNQKQNIRFKLDDVILYEPNMVQREELRTIIIDNTKIDIDKGEASAEYEYSIIRYIFKFLTSIGDEVDELSDDELEEQINNGNHKIAKLMREIEDMLREIMEEVVHQYMNEVKNLNEQLRLVDMSSEIDEIRQNFDNIAKKKGLDVTLDDVIAEELKLKEMKEEIKK